MSATDYPAKHPLSYTRMQVLKCPLRYRREYIQRIDTPRSTEPQVIGHVFHEMAHDYLAHCADKGNRDYAQAEIIKDRYMAENLDLDHETEREVEMIFHRFVRLWDWDYPIHGVELQLGITADGEPAEFSEHAFARGQIDLLEKLDDHTVRITDWKTSWSDIHDPLQLNIYALLVSAQPEWRHIDRFIVRAAYPRWGDLQEHQREVAGEELDETLQKLQHAAARLKNRLEQGEDAFDPRPGEQCKYCAHQASCDAYQTASDHDFLISTEEDAQEAAELLIGLRRVSKNISKQIRDWCATEGQVNAGGEPVGYYSYESERIDAEAGVEALREWREKTGEDLLADARLSGISKSKLKANKRAELKEALDEEATETQTKTRFDAPIPKSRRDE